MRIQSSSIPLLIVTQVFLRVLRVLRGARITQEFTVGDAAVDEVFRHRLTSRRGSHTIRVAQDTGIDATHEAPH